MSQLIMGEKVTNKKFVSAGIALAFADFKKDHPSVVFSLKESNIKGYSGSLSAACVLLATTYLNHIVENFKRRILYYLPIKLSMIYQDMAKGLLYKLAEDYCWEIITNGNPEWPTKTFDIVSICKTAEVTTLFDELREKLPLPPTVAILASAPSKFFGYLSLEEVIDGENKFTCFIQSDGFGVCFGFAQKAKEVQETPLELEYFRDEEVQRYFQPCVVDPGCKQVFTSIIHHEEGKQEVRRCSSKERSCYTGSLRRADHVEKLKASNGIKIIETNFPSPRTVNNGKRDTYVSYALKYAPELFTFYNERSSALRFHNYQGRQRSNAEMANILLNGDKEAKKLVLDGRLVITLPPLLYNSILTNHDSSNITYNKHEPKKKKFKVQFRFSDKVPLVVFGDGMRNKDTVKFKGLTSGVTGVLTNELRKIRRLYKSSFIDINEFRTSKVSSVQNVMNTA
ncbi:hypothetical protein MFLAVUS_000187 [Mucor flavus]|uniref:PNPLA domain-containing protein n=1 Tax=Mucor flavus TaxID=439312 RepID=A0ABP9YIZ7_9FUNG